MRKRKLLNPSQRLHQLLNRRVFVKNAPFLETQKRQHFRRLFALYAVQFDGVHVLLQFVFAAFWHEAKVFVEDFPVVADVDGHVLAGVLEQVWKLNEQFIVKVLILLNMLDFLDLFLLGSFRS